MTAFYQIGLNRIKPFSVPRLSFDNRFCLIILYAKHHFSIILDDEKLQGVMSQKIEEFTVKLTIEQNDKLSKLLAVCPILRREDHEKKYNRFERIRFTR